MGFNGTSIKTSIKTIRRVHFELTLLINSLIRIILGGMGFQRDGVQRKLFILDPMVGIARLSCIHSFLIHYKLSVLRGERIIRYSNSIRIVEIE